MGEQTDRARLKQITEEISKVAEVDQDMGKIDRKEAAVSVSVQTGRAGYTR